MNDPRQPQPPRLKVEVIQLHKVLGQFIRALFLPQAFRLVLKMRNDRGEIEVTAISVVKEKCVGDAKWIFGNCRE